VELFEAIRTRRSISSYRPDAIPRETLREIVEAATWAPNHRHNEPWFFHVVEGPARDRLAARLLETPSWATLDDKARGKLQKTAERLRAAPAVIFVQTFPADNAYDAEENYAAACCAVQNLLLAAHATGLGAIWRTGVPCEHPAVKTFLGLPPDAKLVAAIFLGRPAGPPQAQTRRPLAERARFIEE
jgi:nitroreductase